MKRLLVGAIAGALMLAASSASAQEPNRNVNPHRHPNLAAAQKLSQEAYDKLTAAQKANEWDMGGHAKKAKELLEEANVQMKLAAEAANRR